MAAGNIYELKLFQTLLGQEVLSTYHYLQTVGSDNADNLFDLFEANVIPLLRALQSSSLVYNRAEIKNLADPTDFWLGDLNDIVGLATGVNMPPHDAYSLTMYTTRTDAKAGGKRLAGCLEEFNSNGVIVGTALIRLAAICAQLETPLASGGGTWRPIVYGSRKTLLGKYPNNVGGVSFLAGITTQNTRKYYTN